MMVPPLGEWCAGVQMVVVVSYACAVLCKAARSELGMRCSRDRWVFQQSCSGSGCSGGIQPLSLDAFWVIATFENLACSCGGNQECLEYLVCK